MDVGRHVMDADDDDPDLAVVVDRPGTSIDDHTVTYSDGTERTVAEDNPDYDPDEPTVSVAFVESGLDRNWSGWTDADAAALHEGTREHDVKLYHFPESRLRTVPEGRAAATRADAALDVDGLRERLEGASWDIEFDADGALLGEKMGEQYRITPEGEVEGEGRIRTPLENIVEEYTD